MSLNQISAYLHKNRIADVVAALASIGIENIAVTETQGLLTALHSDEQRYSIELGIKVIDEVKLEIVCEEGDRTNQAISVLLDVGKTSQAVSGRVYILPINKSFLITN